METRYALLLVKAHQVLDVVLATEEDRQPLMDPSRLDVQDPLGTRRGSSTGLLGQVSHGEGLVQDTQLAVLGLGVARVPKDSSVQQGSVDVGYHRSDVSCAVGALVVLGVLDRFHCESAQVDGSASVPEAPPTDHQSASLTVLQSGLVEVFRVSLVERVDLASLGNSDLGVGQDELSERLVQGETVDSLTGREDQL